MLEDALIEALHSTCVLSGVPLLVTLIVGLLIAFIQSGLQLQEQSLGFVFKLCAIALTFFLFGSLGLTMMIELFHKFLSSSITLTV